MSLVLENPEVDSVLQMWPRQCWTEGKDKDRCPQPAGNTPADAAWAINSLFSILGSFLAPDDLGCPPGPPSVFLSNCLWAGKCPACVVPGFVPSQVQDFAEVPVSSFLQSDEVPLDGSTALWHISSADMLGIRPSINLWDTLLVTGLQLDLVSLVTTSWAQLCVRLSTSGKMAEHILPSTEAALSHTAQVCYRLQVWPDDILQFHCHLRVSETITVLKYWALKFLHIFCFIIFKKWLFKYTRYL